MSSSPSKTVLSVATRFSGAAIAIVLPKKDDYLIVGNQVLAGTQAPETIYQAAADLWESCINEPREKMNQLRIGPRYLTINHEGDGDSINRLLKESQAQAEYIRLFDVPAEKAEAALMSLQRLFAGQKLKTAPEISMQIEKAVLAGDTLDFEKGFRAIPLSVAAIAQAIADLEFGEMNPVESLEMFSAATEALDRALTGLGGHW